MPIEQVGQVDGMKIAADVFFYSGECKKCVELDCLGDEGHWHSLTLEQAKDLRVLLARAIIRCLDLEESEAVRLGWAKPGVTPHI